MSNTVNVVVILDKSGSMLNRRDETIASLNAYFKDLAAKDEADYRVFLSTFDTHVQYVFIDKAIREVELSHNNYAPEGWTALLDAVGVTVSGVRDNGHKTLCIIYTDGEENSSRVFNQATIRSIIKAKRKAGWEFVFLGANEEAWKTGLQYGVIYSGTADPLQQRAVWKGLARTTSAYTVTGTPTLEANIGLSNVHNDD